MNDVVASTAVQAAGTDVATIAQNVSCGDKFVRQTTRGESAYSVAEVISRDAGDAVVKLHGLGAHATFGDFKETVSKLLRSGYCHRPQVASGG